MNGAGGGGEDGTEKRAVFADLRTRAFETQVIRPLILNLNNLK